MKCLNFTISSILVFAIVSSQAKQKYEDSPMGLTSKGLKLLEGYSEQARSTLSTFDARLTKKEGNDRYYVVTRIKEGDLFEQIFVEVSEKKSGRYLGIIASEPLGPIAFDFGSTIKVPEAEVHDWVIIDSEGNETGNLTGKALEALQIGAVTFILSMHPEDGKYSKFEVVGVRNPRTQQDIIDIVPEDIIEAIEKRAKREFGRITAVGDEVRL